MPPSVSLHVVGKALVGAVVTLEVVVVEDEEVGLMEEVVVAVAHLPPVQTLPEAQVFASVL